MEIIKSLSESELIRQFDILELRSFKQGLYQKRIMFKMKYKTITIFLCYLFLINVKCYSINNEETIIGKWSYKIVGLNNIVCYMIFNKNYTYSAWCVDKKSKFQSKSDKGKWKIETNFLILTKFEGVKIVHIIKNITESVIHLQNASTRMNLNLIRIN